MCLEYRKSDDPRRFTRLCYRTGRRGEHVAGHVRASDGCAERMHWRSRRRVVTRRPARGGCPRCGAEPVVYPGIGLVCEPCWRVIPAKAMEVAR